MTDSLYKNKQHLNLRQLQQLQRMYILGKKKFKYLVFDREDVNMLKMTVGQEETSFTSKNSYFLYYLHYIYVQPLLGKTILLKKLTILDTTSLFNNSII